tara:strand:- start:413648 stop:413794 length:147 start_codon:yes stop_codon:yes gene_type:complete
MEKRITNTKNTTPSDNFRKFRGSKKQKPKVTAASAEPLIFKRQFAIRI